MPQVVQKLPTGCAQKFQVRFQSGLLIAARTTLAMVVDQRMLKEWTGLGIMLVADVHFRRSVAGFQVLTVANISMHSHGSGDDGTSIDSLKAMADDIVGIIENRGVRVLAGDFGCALFALAQLIRGSGVQLHVAALRSGTDNMDDQPFVDSCAVFLVGPVSKVKLCLPIGDTKLPVAVRSKNSLGMGAYIRGCGEPSDATAKASMDTLLKGDCDGSNTARWCTMPPSAEKTARTFTHTGDTINTVVVPLMIFMGTHPRRTPESQQRRNARAAERKGKGKGKGARTGATRAMRVDPPAVAGFPMAPRHAYSYPYGYYYQQWY